MPTLPVLNGKNVTLDVDPNMPLLWAIRESTGLHGTKFDCGMAQYSACTMQPNGTAIRSCALSVSTIAGEHVTTIEGIQSKPGRAVQDAWVRLQVSQYGYCQSGQVMSATTLLEWNASPGDAGINAATNGNVYRCAAYMQIRATIHEAADTLKA